jgi:hypothetical protein
MEGTMGDEEHDKSIIEKTIETVKDMATKASDAAKKALEPPQSPARRLSSCLRRVMVLPIP